MPEGTIISVSASRALTGAVVIEGSDAFPHAVRRLKESFPGIDWIVGAADGKRPAVILVADAELAEGAFHIGSETALSPVVHVSGGQVSGVIYGIEELIKRGGATPDRLSVAAEPIEASPGLAYRTFRTWDHSTNWQLSQIGQQEIGVFNPYGKPPSGFLADYRRLVDFCSRNRIAAIVIYGFLRDSHGGIETARELCRYANERGVRILPGIAIGSYGGSIGRASTPTISPRGPGATRNSLRLWEGGGIPARRPFLPAELPALRLHHDGLPERAGNHGLDGRSSELAGRDL